MDPITQSQVPAANVGDISQPQPPPIALAQQLVTAASAQPTQTPQMPARAKESGPATSNELAGFVEVVGGDSIEKEPLPPEVSSWMEKVSRDTTGEKPPEIVIASPTTPPPANTTANGQLFVLPLGEQEAQKGLHQGVNNSVRWLSEWCMRLVKKLGGETTFR